jgi:hypothetical protein
VRLSRRQDETGNPKLFQRMQMISGPGIVIYCLTVTFASFDWVMSLEPKWFSSIFGLHFLIGQGLSALTFCTLVIAWLAKRDPMHQFVKPSHLHDYGKLTLAFTMVWAYFSFSQLLIIWSANLPEEVPFYLHRIGPWKPVSVALVVLHFFLPFLLLLSRDLKRTGKTLRAVAILLLFARWLDIYWHTAPVLHPQSVLPYWLDVVVPFTMLSLWTWLFLTFLSRRPLLPIHDPYLPEALAHESGH